MESQRERFRRLFEPIHPRVVAFARHLCRSRSEGDDLLQEALVRAFTRLDTLRDEGAFRTWLFRIVISVHRNRSHVTFWRRFVPLVEDPPAHASGDYRIAGALPETAEATRRARAALATLPAVQREAIVLFEIEGWLVEDIAAAQRVSPSAVKSRLARGRARLRTYYAKTLGTAVPALVSGDTT